MHLLSFSLRLGLCAAVELAPPGDEGVGTPPPLQRPQRELETAPHANPPASSPPASEQRDPPAEGSPSPGGPAEESPAPAADPSGEVIDLRPSPAPANERVDSPPADETFDTEVAVDPEYGPFYEEAPPSDVVYPGERKRDGPPLSVAKGAFCFVEDSACKSAVIIDADVGAGLNVVTSEHGLDLPYTQVRVRWGATLRPVAIARKRWHPWGVGVVGSWSIGSASIIPANETNEAEELAPIEAYRVALINQIWLTRKRSAAHLDLTLGAVNSPVLEFSGRFWGTHAEAAIGFGGWAQMFLGADFLDRDVRAIVGIRGHGIFTGPLIGLVVLGLVAGGVAL